MLIPEEKVLEILERTDLVALVGRSVELKRAGRSFKGLCPFHGERTPSFMVSAERRRFKCFGCGTGGDAIGFVMRQEGKGFVEAARSLAEQAGVRLEAGADDLLLRERRELRRAHDLAARFYAERLWDEEAGRLGREHLAKRGVTKEAARAFGLGYAPSGFGELAARFAAEGLLELGLSSGLLARKEGVASARPYDFFRGRLMIPIRGPEGATVAFGGRVIEGTDDRKFINSRESAVFRKGDLLFAIDAARDPIRRSGQALLVEGYFDALVLHQQGIQNAVALCSASLTAEQVKLLRRFEAKELVLVLDGDDAGRRGVSRAAGALLAAGMPTRVVALPAGIDPDEHVLAVGAERFREAVRSAPPLTLHLVRAALPSGTSASFEEKLRALDDLRPILAQIPQGLERSLFLQVLSRGLGVPELELRGRLEEPPPRVEASAVARPPQAGPTVRAAPGRAPEKRPVETMEEVLLVAHLLVEPELCRVAESAVLEDLAHPGLRALAAEQLQAALDGHPRSPDEILEGLDARLVRRVQEVMRIVLSQPEASRREEFRQKCQVQRQRLARREEEQLQRQLTALAAEIASRRRAGDGDPALEPLNEEHLALVEQKRALSLARRGAVAAGHAAGGALP